MRSSNPSHPGLLEGVGDDGLLLAADLRWSKMGVGRSCLWTARPAWQRAVWMVTLTGIWAIQPIPREGLSSTASWGRARNVAAGVGR